MGMVEERRRVQRFKKRRSGSAWQSQDGSEGELVALRKSRFAEVMGRMPMYMERLGECGAISMYRMADRRALRRKLPASKGIYVLYERGKPMYVGRSDNLADRLLKHGQPSGGSETATFAFNIAKQEFPGSSSMVRKDLQNDEVFQLLFDAAKERVRRMEVRVIGIVDPVEQTIFEVYAHLELQTPFNSFENH